MNTYMFPIPPINNNEYYYIEEIKKLHERIKKLEERITQLEKNNHKPENSYLQKDENYYII